jgi:lysophospholipase L1-like esterase
MKRILFQGDSITDAHRLRDNDNFAGNGYPTLLKARIGADYPNEYECINRGVSGDRVVDIYARVRRDVIKLKPDIVSILVGINDVWHEFMNGNGVNAEKYALVYKLLLDEIKSELPETKLVILEPFVLNGTATCNTGEYPERYETFRREIKLRSEAAFDVCQSHGGTFVPLQGVLDAACEKAPAGHWLIDGVHPTAAGHELIAREWIKTVKL